MRQDCNHKRGRIAVAGACYPSSTQAHEHELCAGGADLRGNILLRAGPERAVAWARKQLELGTAS
jgi:hypothetical protein